MAFGDYVASLCAEFGQIAKAHRLSTLRYLLSLAYLEAERVSRGAVFPDEGSGEPSH